MSLHHRYSSSGWSCKLSMASKGIALCLLVLLSIAITSYGRLLLLGRTKGEKLRRNLLENGLGQTPPMG